MKKSHLFYTALLIFLIITIEILIRLTGMMLTDSEKLYGKYISPYKVTTNDNLMLLLI